MTNPSALQRLIRLGDIDAALTVIAGLKDSDDTLNNRDGEGATALHDAVNTNQYDLVDALLRKGIDTTLTARTPNNLIPIDALTAALMYKKMDAAQALVDFGCSVNSADEHNNTLAHRLVILMHDTADVEQALQFIKSHGADIDRAKNHRGETPLFAACKAGAVTAARYLLAEGADAKSTNADNTTLLHLAAQYYNPSLTTLLVAAGAEIDARNHIGQTALHIAAHHNRKDTVRELLACGANPLLKDRKGRSADQICLGPLQQVTHNIITEAQRKWRHNDSLKKPSSKPFQNRR